MKTLKKIFSVILVLALSLSVLAGCGDKTPDTTEPSGDNTGAAGTYNVTVTTAGGMAMEGLDLYVYADSSLADLKDYGKTDAEGKATFNLPKAEGYAVTVSGAPKGYDVKESYTFSGNTANITLTSSVITDGSLSDVTLGLGDVMVDFTVTSVQGESFTLSEVLKEKKMALINFFFTTCGPCANEFPYMDEAYQMYSDNAAVIALDPLEQDEAVKAYQASMGLSFPMAACPAAWSQTFGITGYPTSVVVDQYGVICLIEMGGITSLRPFVSIFDHFTAEDYEQKICVNGVNDVITVMKPTYEMPASEEIVATINNGDIPVTYRAEEGESGEYSWPFIITEKNGEKCIKASNSGVEDSFAILYADVELKAGEAIAFDYLVSSENGNDALVVIVDGEDIYQMSGVDETETWKSCYPWVAKTDGTYEVALCYLKDESDNAGDDTVYVKNMRIVKAEDVDTPTYLPRQVATSEDGFEYTYEDVFYNEADGYYHVGSENGPLLLANLMGYSSFSEEETIWDIVYEGAVTVDGESIYDTIVEYFNYASNSNLNGYCSVNKELSELLMLVDEQAGFDDEDDKEWLRICQYYENYGTDVQLEDPIKGLATYAAYEAKLGVGVETNKFEYNGRPIMPRGLIAKFVPEKSGVYRITSHNESSQGVDGWLFDENRNELLTYERDERMFTVEGEVSMVFYMEAGKPYFIDIAFWDVYEAGTITYDIEYIAPEYRLFRLASQGYFTYDTDATGEAMYHTIAGGIDVVLGEDGIYYEDLGDGKKGSKLYADFTGLTAIFDTPISTVGDVKGMIDKGAFDFSKNEYDMQVLGYLNKNGGDAEKAKEEMKTAWGEDYEYYYEEYKVDEVLASKYHGKGEDYTEEIKTYLDDIITTGSEEARGCVVVTERLAELLQLLMDKYTFENVDHSWTKLCYYYDYLGPNG